ncbi:MAG TPA: FecR domain-containing protein [Dyadobacter sp.]|nr:FecR domain-containing protein [Dyadobacter sp.]
MNWQRLAFLLEKQKNGTCSDDERAELDAWYHSFGPRERDIEMELENDPEEAGRVADDIRSTLPNFTQVAGIPPEATPEKTKIIHWTRMAAAIFLALLLAGSIWWKQHRVNGDDFATISTGKDQLARIVLPDSSSVWVKAGSTFKYAKQFSGASRDVYLDGEAFFDVTHDATRPFIVHTTDLRIKVLGTTFNVKSYPADKTVEATLVKGKVLVEKKQPSEPDRVVLAPRERAVYSREAKTMTVTHIENMQELRALDLAGREKQSLTFDAVPFTEVVSRLENRFQVKIHIANRQNLSCLFTADFEHEPLAEILNLLALSHNVTYRIRGNEVFVNGSICTDEANPNPPMTN